MRVIKYARIEKDSVKESEPAPFDGNDEEENRIVNVTDVTRQNVMGFGGAFTDSSAFNYARLGKKERKIALEMLFGSTGLGYSFCRVPMGSSDFSPYMYDNAKSESDFDINDDKKYKIPFIKDALLFTGGKLRLFASPWSPPAFMKDNAERLHGGKLKKEFYVLWAECFCKFIDAYAAEGIEIYAVTLQNEPHATQTWESCVYSTEEEIEFAGVLKQAFVRRGIKTKILAWDHNKERLVEKSRDILSGTDIDGMAFHWYSGSHFDAVEIVRDLYPQKILIESEFCCGMKNGKYDSYTEEIIGNLSHGADAITEWNMILDSEGGPYHDRTGGCMAPLIADKETGKIRKGKTFDAAYMVAHFVGADALALRTTVYDERIKAFACRRGDGRTVVCLKNTAEEKMPVCLRIAGKHVWSFALNAGQSAAVVAE